MNQPLESWLQLDRKHRRVYLHRFFMHKNQSIALTDRKIHLLCKTSDMILYSGFHPGGKPLMYDDDPEDSKQVIQKFHWSLMDDIRNLGIERLSDAIIVFFYHFLDIRPHAK